jgi:hypothetical protein
MLAVRRFHLTSFAVSLAGEPPRRLSWLIVSLDAASDTAPPASRASQHDADRGVRCAPAVAADAGSGGRIASPEPARVAGRPAALARRTDAITVC